MQPVEYDPFSKEFQADPYPTYHRVRALDPVLHREWNGFHVWIVTRHADVAAILRDPRCSASKFPQMLLEQIRQQPDSPFAALARAAQGMMLIKDPPDHTRLRNLVNKAFTPRVVEALRPRVQQIVDELLDDVRGRDEMDLIADFAAPLPIIVISELLGVPAEDRAKFKVWSDRMATFIDGTIRAAGLAEAAQASLEIEQYMRGIVAERRARPRDDLISGLVAAHEGRDVLSEQELFSTIVLILGAGHETTTNLIGNGILALLRNPGELARLRAEPALIRPAVEELLRYDSPVQATSRIPSVDIELRGKAIPKGQEINVILGAANRDPEVFADPDRLDLGRADSRHLSFGLGIHFCLGAALARLEGQIAIGSLLDRLPRLEIAVDDPPRRPGFVLRGLASLPVRF